MPATGTSFVPHALMALLIAIWAGTFVVNKIGLELVSPVALVASRFTIAALCLLPFFVFTRRERHRGALGPGLLAGLVLAVPYFMQVYGLRETTASMGGFVTGLIVLLVAVGGRLFFGSRFGARSIVGLVLGLAGIVVLCVAGGDDGARQSTVRGILLQVGSAVGFAVHILLLSHFGRKLAVIPFTFWQLAFTGAVATIATFAISGIARDGSNEVEWTGQLMLVLAYLGVLASGIAIAVQAKVQHRIPPTHVALLFALQPLFAAIAGWVFQGDMLGALQWTGGALIIAGVVVTSLDRISVPVIR